jgi:hypothetical protein
MRLSVAPVEMTTFKVFGHGFYGQHREIGVIAITSMFMQFLECGRPGAEAPL